jgi:hypothetical protein
VVVAEGNLWLCQPSMAGSPRKSNKELAHTVSYRSSLAHGGAHGIVMERLKDKLRTMYLFMAPNHESCSCWSRTSEPFSSS